MSTSTRRRSEKPLSELSDKQLDDRIHEAERAFAELPKTPEGLRPAEITEVLARGEQEVQTIEAGVAERKRRTELREQEQRERVEQGRQEFADAVSRMPLARELRSRADRRKAKRPVAAALEFVSRRGHPELNGAKLVVDRLSEDDARELVALVEDRLRPLSRQEEGVGPLSEAESTRYEALVGAAAGNPDLFSQKRNEAEVKAKMAELEEQAQVATLPRRVKWEEPGAVTLPRDVVHSWLVGEREGDWTVMDVGALAVLLGCFENRDARPIEAGRFEEDAGEPVLVIAAGIGDELRFRGQTGGSPMGEHSGGFIRLRSTLAALERHGWVKIERSVTETRIRLGERAKALREGGSQASASA